MNNTELDYYLDNGFMKEFTYRKVFVSFEKNEKSSIAIVMNDRNKIGSFTSKANNEREFEIECLNWLESNHI